MPTVILGVSGSVACYRACDLARELMRRGFEVRTCLTASAQNFVRPALFEALTGSPCLTHAFDEPARTGMAHIEWARDADLMLVAPATANVLNKLAAGFADDMLTTLWLAFDGPKVVAPAMNPTMLTDPSVQESLRVLQERGATVVEAEEGLVACGEQGRGKFAGLERILDAAEDAARRARSMHGMRVLITSGATHEPIDDVRFVGNRSSGKMGVALARAARMLGAEVDVVAGPQEAVFPAQCRVISVRTAREMLEQARALARGADWILGAAAVSDYRPASPVAGKIRRSSESLSLELVRNPDVIAELAALAPSARAVAFAAEPDANLDHARAKLVAKVVGAIAVNDVSRSDVGFGGDYNELTLLRPNLPDATSGRRTKLGCAIWLLETLVAQDEKSGIPNP